MFGLGKNKKKDIEIQDAIDTETTAVIETKDAKEAEEVKMVTTYDGSKTASDNETAITTGIEKQKEDDEPPPLTYKEARALKKSEYSDKIANNPKFKDVYVLRNKKTGQVVEIRAASSVHACNIIGWRSRKVEILQHTVIEEPKPAEETRSMEIKAVKREETKHETTSSSSNSS